MATSKKATTSKTARVMNLLSKNREEPTPEVATPVEETPTAPISSAPPAETATPAPVAPAQPTAPHPTTRPIISSMQADSAISDQVFSALEDALNSELGETAPPAKAPPPAPAPAPVVPTEPIAQPMVEPEPAPEVILEPAPQPTPEPPVPVIEVAPEPVVATPEPVATVVEVAPAPVPVATAEPVPEPVIEPSSAPISPVTPGTMYVNVMEALVEDRAMKYIEMFGLCKCSRCVADVKALALNRLEAKYVVMQEGEVIPRISLYEGKYAAAVTAQLLSACRIVMEHPRHDRKI